MQNVDKMCIFPTFCVNPTQTLMPHYAQYTHMPKTKETFVRLRNDVAKAADYMLAEQGTVIAGIPGVSLSRSAYVNEIVMNDLAKRGHYPPRDNLQNEDPVISSEPDPAQL